jgi:hypothetical protein
LKPTTLQADEVDEGAKAMFMRRMIVACTKNKLKKKLLKEKVKKKGRKVKQKPA